MTLPVVWIAEANEDLLEARAWYDNIRLKLGERFAWAVEATVEAIAEHPLQYPVVHRSRRRAGVRRFPYGIFFEVQADRIVVIACFHGRREPRRWQSRQESLMLFATLLLVIFAKKAFLWKSKKLAFSVAV